MVMHPTLHGVAIVSLTNLFKPENGFHDAENRPHERNANARLIAAAPDLLAAAQCAANVLFLLQDEVKALGCNAKNVQEQLRAAIALATKEIQP